MSDTGGPEANQGMAGKLWTWVKEVYAVLAWGFDAMGSMGTPTAAEEMLDRLISTRPAELIPPDGATETERGAIEQGYQGILEMLRGLVDVENTSDAEREVARVAGLVTSARQRIVDERRVRGEALATHLTSARAKVPVGANAAEQAKLEKICDDALAGLKSPWTPEGVAAGEKAKVDADDCILVIDAAVKDRETRRTGLTGRLAKVATPIAPASDMRALAKRRADLIKAIANADDKDKLDAAETELVAIEKEFPELTKLHAALAAGREALAAAKAGHRAAMPKVEQGFNSWLAAQIAAAEKAMLAAKDPAGVAAQVKVLGDALAQIAAAEAFAKTLVDWRIQTDFYIAVGVAATDRAEVTKKRNAQAELAGQAAAKVDFAAAEKALKDFDTTAAVDPAAMAEAAAWQKKLTTFHATYDADLETVFDTKIDPPLTMGKQFGAIFTDIAAATSLATKNADYVGAGAALDALIPKITEIIACCKILKRFAAMGLASRRAGDASGDEYKAAVAALKTGDTTTGLAELRKVDARDGDLAEAKRRVTAINGKANDIFKGEAAPYKSYVTQETVAANAEIAKPDFVEAKLRLDEAEKRLDLARSWAGPFNAAVARRNMVDGGNHFDVLAQAISDIAGGDPAASLTSIVAAGPMLDLLARYEALKPQVEKLRNSLTAGTEPYKLADKGLLDAAALHTKKDAAGAVSALEGVIADPSVDALAADVALWQSRSAAAKRRTDRVILTFNLAEAEAALKSSLADAIKFGDTDNKPSEGLEKLDEHDKLLTEAGACAAVYQRMLGVQAALTRAEGQFTGPVNLAKIYQGKAKAEITKEVSDAIADVKAAKFAKATAAFKATLAACKDAIGNTAKLYEDADGVDSNAGHSIARHGPDVSDEKLLKRLLTGEAPDGATSFCPSSSKFENAEAWLAGREKAAAAALAGGVDISLTSLPIAGAVLRKQVIIDHGGPIDKAFDGVKAALGVTDTGDIKELGNFETFEPMDGITKSITLFVFEIASPDGNATRPKDLAEYKTRYKLANGGTDATDVTGRWVMMQHFPLVKGWNQEKQDYD